MICVYSLNAEQESFNRSVYLKVLLLKQSFGSRTVDANVKFEKFVLQIPELDYALMAFVLETCLYRLKHIALHIRHPLDSDTQTFMTVKRPNKYCYI